MVTFVGAGPGAEDLITVRGQNKLKCADVVIYAGSLVNINLLDVCRSECKIYDSAKMTLEQVIETIKDAEEKKLSVVRLHTGDPSLYGAVREQMDCLDALGIKYESVPGVSSFCAAAASLNIEYTLPELSQSLIITRVSGKTLVPEKESVESFARHNASMVFFLSTGLLKELSERLVKGGCPENTPAAIVYKASWPDEKKYICTVGTLEETAAKNAIKKTALVIVGDVILHSDYERSKLYDPKFSTEFRKAEAE